MLPLRSCEKHQYLLPRPRVVANRLLVHVRLQRLESRLVLLCPDRLQPHEHADAVNDGRLTEPRQSLHHRPHCCLYGLGLLLLPGIGLCHGFLDARHQLGSLHARQIRQPLRPLQPRVYLVSLSLLDGVLRPHLDVGPRLGHLLAHLRPCRVAIWHDVWAIVVGLLNLKILRPRALDQQPLAMDSLTTLADALLYLCLLYPARTTSFSCY